MSSLKFTIYEILGYLAPGTVGLAAFTLVLWTAFMPDHPLPLVSYSFSKEGIALAIFAAYAFGHLVQGLSNLHPNAEQRAVNNKNHAALLDGARIGLAAKCGIDLVCCPRDTC